jgi:hypothetical protein
MSELRIFFVSFLLAGTVSAGPPMLTDDPDTPGPGVWEINFATTAERSGGDWSWELPIVDINYGVGETIQMKFEVPWIFSDIEGAAVDSALGNPEVGIKWRFLDQEKYAWNVATYPQYAFEAPNSSIRRGVVEQGAEFLLPVEIGKDFGDVIVYGEAGYAWIDGGVNEWIFGAVGGYEVSDRLTLMTELYWIAEESFDEDTLIIAAGLKWNFSNTLALLGSGGRSLREPAGEGEITVFYLGLQALF